MIFLKKGAKFILSLRSSEVAQSWRNVKNVQSAVTPLPSDESCKFISFIFHDSIPIVYFFVYEHIHDKLFTLTSAAHMESWRLWQMLKHSDECTLKMKQRLWGSFQFYFIHIFHIQPMSIAIAIVDSCVVCASSVHSET